MVKKALKPFKINAELNVVDGSMTVRTTRQTWDPFKIIKARDLIKEACILLCILPCV